MEDATGGASPWREVRGQVLPGREEFVTKLKSPLDDVRRVKEVPKVQRFPSRPDSAVLFGERAAWSYEERTRLVRAAHLEHGYTLAEIAAAIDL